MIETVIEPLHDRRRADRRAADATDAPIETLAAELDAAMARGEIGVLFQPQVRLADGAIAGAEALARWDRPQGAVGADLLFAAAERAGLERALAGHIQARALAAVAGWTASLAGLDVALNVTAADLTCDDFARLLLGRVAASGLSPDRLVVEITETALIADLPAAAALLESLRRAGVRTAIDDFGSGYAGFAYLRALPFDRLKIDRSLVADVAESPRARALVRGIVGLARALDLGIVAEGVETAAQRDALAAEGCDRYQGFLCAGAVDSAALARLVEGCG